MLGFSGNYLYYVRLARRLYEKTLSQTAARFGLSAQEADVLSFLHENPELDCARDIALYRDVSRPYISKAVESLASRGLVTISIDARDRRLQHISLTENAREISQALHDALEIFYRDITSVLSPQELASMAESILKCAQLLVDKSGREE